MESKHKKLQTSEHQKQQQKVQLEERLGQEEAAVTALREEVHGKEQLIHKLRTSTKEVHCVTFFGLTRNRTWHSLRRR